MKFESKRQDDLIITDENGTKYRLERLPEHMTRVVSVDDDGNWSIDISWEPTEKSLGVDEA